MIYPFKNITVTFPVFFLCLMLAGCGFTPLYGSKDKIVETSFNQIHIANIPDRNGQYLRNDLIDRLYNTGRPQNPAYQLKISPIRKKHINLDITKNSDATRAQLRLETTMELKDNATGETLIKRELVSITSYNILSGQFTTSVSEDNALTNALNDLARQTETQLALYFNRR